MPALRSVKMATTSVVGAPRALRASAAGAGAGAAEAIGARARSPKVMNFEKENIVKDVLKFEIYREAEDASY